MKKRMTLLTALGLAAMLITAGCGKEAEAPVVEDTPEMIVEEVETPEENLEEEVVPLSIHTETNQKTYCFEDGEDAYLYLQYCDVTVEGDGYEKLKRGIEKWSLERSDGLRSLYASFEEMAVTEVKENEEFTGYSLYQTVTTARADTSVVSLLDDTYQYTGGVHGSYLREGISFDSKSGKRLGLSDILSDPEIFVEEAKERIVYELRENYGEELFEDYQTAVEELWQDGQEPQWYLDASGIVIVLQEYTVGPYSLGTPEIHLPYTEFKPYIKAMYLPSQSEGVAVFGPNQEVFLSLPGSLEEVPMMLLSEQQEETTTNSLWLGQNELQLEEYLILEKSYIVRKGEEVYCMLVVDMASDDYETYIYRLTDGVIEKVDQIQAAIDAGNINSHEVAMEFWVNLLGTYGGKKTYRFDENGKFVTDDTEFRLEKNEYVLTTTVDLPVTVEEQETMLSAGSNMILNATDSETYVTFTIPETGQTGILNVQRDPENISNISINGINENECFEVLPYAG